MNDRIDTESLGLSWSTAPWDEAVMGCPVWQLADIQLHGTGADADMALFEEARDLAGVGLVSCRLGHERLDVSMFLESHGFRFIEMMYQPALELTSDHLQELPPPSLTVARGSEDDLPLLIEIAGASFANERFHMDPRLGPELGNRRYQAWVRQSLDHPTQQLYVLRDNEEIVSFFVIEDLDDGACYWHLNAVSPKHQGQRLGLRSWSTMLHQASAGGATRVLSSIAARNHRVLNLYARLGFRFLPPRMTFHWVRGDLR